MSFLLVDSDPARRAADRIFYIGKGRDSWALHHALGYVDAVKQNSLAEATAKLAETGVPSAVKADVASVEHAKIQRIREIVDAVRDIRVDLLRDGLSSQSAYAIESAAIDVLGPENLTNRIAGHDHFRAPASAVARMVAATHVAIHVPALQVP